MSTSITFLGGLGEIGRNCAVLETGGKLAMLDCGLMFPEEDMLGVDLVLPDFSSVIERARDVACVVLTHGHEDHVGALAYFLREVNVPVYGTALSVELARSRIEDLGIDADLRPVTPGEWVNEGPVRFALVQVAHSVPQAAGAVFDTPDGIIVHSGDFKLDPTPIDGVATDLSSFAGFGRRGVRLLLADSTNAERPGFVPSESSLGHSLYEIIAESRGRVIAACFASHLHRVQQIVDAAIDSGRRVAFLGRSMVRNVDIAAGLSLLSVPDDKIVEIDEVGEMDASEVCVVSTGSQGEPFAALSLMAAGEHRAVKLEEGDTVLISATPIPGNEKSVSRVINGLIRRGARVFHGRNANVHVSGHGSRDELLTFLNVVRPQAFVPVHGEYRHLKAHADLAEMMAVPDVVVCEDGDAVVLDGAETIVERRAVPAGYVYLDGTVVGDVRRAIRDRRHLADDGVIVVTVGIDMRTSEIVHGPDLDSHGFMDAPDDVLKSAAIEIVDLIGAGKTDADTCRRKIVQAVRTVTRRETARRPVVIPVVIEF